MSKRRLSISLAALLAGGAGPAPAPASSPVPFPASASAGERAREREAMVLAVANMAETVPISDGQRLSPRVLAAMREVPRHLFVPEAMRPLAYRNQPLAIGHDQTISQPYIVALMTHLLRAEPHHRVLEIGTGSGYQAAILSRLAGQVRSIEIVEPLAREAAARLASLGYVNVTVRAGDGYAGWPEHAPFDRIIVTAAAPHVPQPLIDQLKPGGRMVIPVARRGGERLNLIIKDERGRVSRRELLPVRFVPMTRAPG